MNASQFDGNAAFSGGGFMPSQATQSADPSLAPARNRDSQTLLPLTVKQIKEALSSSSERSNFIVDGVDANNVTVVGMVCDKVERVTDIGFFLDDGTGRLEVHRWANEAIDSKETRSTENGMYVRVIGHLKAFQGKTQLVAFSIRPVVDFNEITYHFTECMYVHTYNTKLQKASNHPTDAPGTSGMNANVYRGNQAMPQYQQSGADRVEGIDKMVLDYLTHPSCMNKESGVHLDDLTRQLNLPLQKIKECIEALEREGLVYSTIDDKHYKSTANG